MSDEKEAYADLSREQLIELLESTKKSQTGQDRRNSELQAELTELRKQVEAGEAGYLEGLDAELRDFEIKKRIIQECEQGGYDAKTVISLLKTPEDPEAAVQSVQRLKEEISLMAQKVINERLGSTPKPQGGSSPISAESIARMDQKEVSAAIKTYGLKRFLQIAGQAATELKGRK